MIFEVFNTKLGLVQYDQDSMYSAVEKAADDYNNTYDLSVLRGEKLVIGVRPLKTKTEFKWFSVTGVAIPIYRLNQLQPTQVDSRTYKMLDNRLTAKNQENTLLL